MNKIFKIIFFIVLGFLIFCFIIKKFFIPRERLNNNNMLSRPYLTMAEEKLERLSLEQKIGQLFLIGFEGKSLTPELEILLKTIHPGGVVLLSRNIQNENQLRRLIADLQKESFKDSGLPFFIAVDQEGGIVSRIEWLKEKTPQSKIKNTEDAYKIGLNRGTELIKLGININLAPVLDITEPDDFLHNRSFQKKAEETGKLARSLIFGQKAAGILTCFKHFPGYGGILFNPERDKLAILSKIPNIFQFQQALMAQPEMIMTSNVVYKEIDNTLFTFSSKGINFLKEKLNDKILIVSDDLSSPVLKNEFSLEKAVILAFQAGIDVLTVAGFDEPKDPLFAFEFFLKAVENGEISEEKINQSVLKIIQLKQNLLK